MNYNTKVAVNRDYAAMEKTATRVLDDNLMMPREEELAECVLLLLEERKAAAAGKAQG